MSQDQRGNLSINRNLIHRQSSERYLCTVSPMASQQERNSCYLRCPHFVAIALLRVLKSYLQRSRLSNVDHLQSTTPSLVFTPTELWLHYSHDRCHQCPRTGHFSHLYHQVNNRKQGSKSSWLMPLQVRRQLKGSAEHWFL